MYNEFSQASLSQWNHISPNWLWIQSSNVRETTHFIREELVRRYTYFTTKQKWDTDTLDWLASVLAWWNTALIASNIIQARRLVLALLWEIYEPPKWDGKWRQHLVFPAYSESTIEWLISLIKPELRLVQEMDTSKWAHEVPSEVFTETAPMEWIQIEPYIPEDRLPTAAEAQAIFRRLLKDAANDPEIAKVLSSLR